MREDLWVNGLLGLKDKYETALMSVDREGISKVINYLRNTDFYMAPASAKNHNSYKGGLVEHSLMVRDNIMDLSKIFPGNLEESLTIVSLLHDVCKVNFYQATSKQTPRKNPVTGECLLENGKKIWDTVSGYDIVDQLPLGHGEKSIIILQRMLPLNNDEIMAIRWHMLGFDASARDYGGAMALRAAAEKYPLVVLLHMADLAACYLEDPCIKHLKQGDDRE